MDEIAFDYTVQPSMYVGRPHIITVTPRPAVDEAVLATEIAGAIRRIVLRAARPFTRRTSAEDLQQIRGVLIIQDQMGGSRNNQVLQENLVLGDVTTEYLTDLVEAIVQSGSEVGISEIEFMFIIDPASIMVGAGKATRPYWDMAPKYENTWKEWSDWSGPINCAAVALAFLLSKPSDNFRHCPAKVRRMSRELQTKMGWGEKVCHRELEEFVKHYPTYKLVVFMPVILKSPYRFEGAEYVNDGDKKILYVTWDSTQDHYAALSNPQAAVREIKTKDYRWCHACCEGFTSARGHNCEYIQAPKKKQIQACRNCGEYGKHNCPLFTCRTCMKQCVKGGDNVHRCAVITDIRDEDSNKFLEEGDARDGKKRALISYDLESKFNIVKTVTKVITGFGLDDEGYYTVADYGFEMLEHEANMVCCQVAFHTNERRTFYGPECIKDFLEFVFSFNDGNNICVAHNASGYDTRLIFRALGDFVDSRVIAPILRGSKILQMKVGKKLFFRDSLLHLPGSLKGLGKEMAPGMALKGFFPYLFNTDANQSYVGPVPALEFFGTSFKSVEERDALRDWHSRFTGPWDFKKELEAYCVNDVAILAKVIEEYHHAQIKLTGLTPWLNTTAPSFIHHVVMEQITKNMEIQDLDVNSDEYGNKVQYAAENGFAVLKPFEYNFAMRALRGGRTDNRVFIRTLTDEEIARGCRIVYVDVVSLYPAVQMTREYPCGFPEIIYWDVEFAPCLKRHPTPEKCNCALKAGETTHLPREGKITSRVGKPQPTRESIMADPAFNGFICVTVKAPKDIPHAVLVRKDEELGKCVASLSDSHNKEVYTSVAELRVAFEMGYELIRVHRLDKYKFGPQPWEMIPKWYLEKMRNSGDEPATEEGKNELVAAYEKFDMGDDGNRPAIKRASKTGLNSIWGKGVERAIKPENLILNHNVDLDKVEAIFKNIQMGSKKINSVFAMSDSTYMYQTTNNGSQISPDLHRGYAPASIMVAAYGRLVLYDLMRKLGTNVLYNDTDSIIFFHDPVKGPMPPTGEILGEWSEEKISKKGIVEFVSLGPKTYALKTRDGDTSFVKAKGLCLNHSNSKQVNFNVMKRMAEDFVEQGRQKLVKVSQTNFIYSHNKGMRTRHLLKDFKINPNELKGVFNPDDGYIWPFGSDQVTNL